MNFSRRIFSVSILALASVVALSAAAKPKTSAAKIYRAYVGNYTSKTESKGIYEFAFDAATGKMSGLELAGESKDPSWVIVHPNGKFVYAANEHGKDSTISAFAIDAKSGKLTLLNMLPALGEDPCHLAIDRSGKFLLAANYSSGNVAVFPILGDGKLGDHTALVTNQGQTGPNKERQEGPHAHWVGAGPIVSDSASIYVADLGLDRVLVYQFHLDGGTLSGPTFVSSFSKRKIDPSAKLSPGTGPRHVAFSRDGARMYVLGEIDSTISAFQMVGHDDFVPTQFQKVRMLPARYSGRNDAAEIEMHPSGKFLYASNRGHESIVVYAVDGKTGKLAQVQDSPTGGKEPRHFAIDPTGQFLLAENQNSNTIVEFRIDPATGKLTPTGETLATPSPVCLAFLPLD